MKLECYYYMISAQVSTCLDLLVDGLDRVWSIVRLLLYSMLCIDTSVHVCDVDLIGDHQVYPMCTTLPMGWSHSVLVAQVAHEHFINTHTNLKSKDRIETTSHDFRLDRMRHQVYIDDLVLLGPDRQGLEIAQRQYIDAASAHGLVVKMSKVVWPCGPLLMVSSVWGWWLMVQHMKLVCQSSNFELFAMKLDWYYYMVSAQVSTCLDSLVDGLGRVWSIVRLLLYSTLCIDTLRQLIIKCSTYGRRCGWSW